jgi:hypothetical protein
MPPTVEDAPDDGKPIQIQTLLVKIKSDLTSRSQKKVCFALLLFLLKIWQLLYYLLNPECSIQHSKLSSLLYTSSEAHVTAKVSQENTETQIIETALLLCSTFYLPPACLVQDCCLVSALQSQLKQTSLIITSEQDQECPNLDDIRSVCAVNFTQFCKQKDVKIIRVHMAELIELVKQEE